jgi:hypothetical protein
MPRCRGPRHGVARERDCDGGLNTGHAAGCFNAYRTRAVAYVRYRTQRSLYFARGVRAGFVRTGRFGVGCISRAMRTRHPDSRSAVMGNRPPKQQKKQPRLTAKEKKTAKQKKKHAADVAPLIAK